MRIIPAIDIIDGKCVRLTQGDYASITIYHEDPLEVARVFEAHGVTSLHIVDLDGAKSSKIVNYGVLEKIAKGTSMSIDFGGGIKSSRDLEIAFDSGASQVTAGSVAVHTPELLAEWLDKYGPDKLILGADCVDGFVATNGWTKRSDQDVHTFIASHVARGIESVICTDINKDGMLSGPATGLYRDILAANQIKLIASGGVRSVADLTTLRNIGCEGAIIGKAIYEGTITLQEIAQLC